MEYGLFQSSGSGGATVRKESPTTAMSKPSPPQPSLFGGFFVTTTIQLPCHIFDFSGCDYKIFNFIDKSGSFIFFYQ
jgi:hypothetical protein